MTPFLPRRGSTPRDVGNAEQVESRPWRIAALLVLPYLMLSIAWSFSNPPGAAPDEPDHLIKAIGSAGFDIGVAGPPVPPDAPKDVLARNASTTRIFDVPARLISGEHWRSEFTCFAFQPAATADCPAPPAEYDGAGTVPVATPVGAYPPFLYLPAGAAARVMPTAESAFLAGRVVVAVMSSGLLLLAVAQLVRWLGRRSVIGLVAALTPMAVFCMSSLSISGLEMVGAITVAAGLSTAVLRPDSVAAASTHWTLAVGGSVLALSRQLGVLVLALLVLALLFGIGWRRTVGLFAARRPSFLAAVGLMGLSALVAVWWERTYDRPAGTQSPLNADAINPFIDRIDNLLHGSVGQFGWLDTPLPAPAFAAWIVVWIAVLTLGLALAPRRGFWIGLPLLVALGALTFGIYAGVFFPVGADAQGRHFLPLVTAILVFVGCCAAARLDDLGHAASARLFVIVGLATGAIHALAVFWNGRRYAVGMNGPFWFVDDARWTPPLGWAPWLLLALLAGALLAAVVVRFRSAPRVAEPEAVVSPADA